MTVMTKIYPSDNRKGESEPPPPQLAAVFLKKPLHFLQWSPSVLTAWKRSSMSFHGTDGFMVFDNRGKLKFRVDNYTRHSWSAAGGGLLLLDAHGKLLFTLKPQLVMGMQQQQWKGYKGEDDQSSKLAFTIRRPRKSSRNTKSEAEIFLGEEKNSIEQSNCKPDLKCEGSFRNRNCKISTTHNGEMVAEISTKRINSTLVLKDDVFSLTVQPGFDPAIMMAFVMILDRICHKPFLNPILCS